MILYLIRHGESTNNTGETHTPDSGLTDRGIAQAHAVAERLIQENIDVLHCSPLLRSMQTAQIISEAIGLTPSVWLNLAEHWGWPQYTGMKRSEIEKQFPKIKLSPEINDQAWWANPSETIDDVYVRMAQISDRLTDEYADTDYRVVCVGHGGSGAILIRHLLQVSARSVSFGMHNCNVNRIQIVPGLVKALSLNDYSHIPRHLRVV